MSNKKHTNRLVNESSLYLKQHAHNPVNWYAWSDEALARSRNENKLIFLSIGYSSCHWCHVMERESFEDESIARYLNEHFVCIKIDREERPDIDAIYMEAVQMMTGQGGWPLNVWLTPNLEPVYGGTYFPPESVHQRPGFMHVLMRLVQLNQEDPNAIIKRAQELKEALKQDLFDHVQQQTVSLARIKSAVKSCSKYFDETHGGFSPAPKFPSAMNIEFLMRYQHVIDDEPSFHMALHSLRKMCLGGLFDQAGGGFHRYSTDAKWLVPHFEKMLYDNALLLSALSDAYQITHETIFKEAINDTISFIKRELVSPSGGFYSALDADSQGEEGTFYIWKYDELEQLIPSEDFPTFAAYYGVHPQGNWEGSIILNRSHTSVDFSMFSQTNHDDFFELSEKWKKILLDARAHRERPALDTKIIASWNAMMLKALCKHWFVTQRDDIYGLIMENAHYLLKNHIIEDELYRISYDGDSAKIPGFCDDYALVSEAFCYVFQVTGEDRWLKTAISLSERMNTLFYDHKRSAFDYTREGEQDILLRKKDMFDNATPGANSAAITALYRIGRIADKPALIDQVQTCIEALGGILGDHSLSFGYLLQTTVEFLSHQKGEIVLSGPKPEPFLEITALKYLPFHIILCVDNAEESAFQTINSKRVASGETKVFLCSNFTCEKPVTQTNELITKLKLLL